MNVNYNIKRLGIRFHGSPAAGSQNYSVQGALMTILNFYNTVLTRELLIERKVVRKNVNNMSQ